MTRDARLGLLAGLDGLRAQVTGLQPCRWFSGQRNKFWVGCLVAALCLCLGWTPAVRAETAALEPAQTLFAVHCAGCHPGGGNVIRRRKTLKRRALERNQVASVEAIATLITQGKGIMSAYGDRLSPEDITLLANYVWKNAENNWQ